MSKRARRTVAPDFEIGSLRDEASVSVASDERVRELARDAIAEIRPLMRSSPPRPITDELGDTATLDETATRLKWSISQIEATIDERRMLAHLSDDGEIAIPVFQFAGSPVDISESVNGALERLGPVCADVRTLLAWFCAPKDELNGATPAAWIREGKPAEMVRLAAERDAERLS